MYFCFWNGVSLCTLGWPCTRCIAQAGPELIVILPTPVSWMLGLQAYVTMAGFPKCSCKPPYLRVCAMLFTSRLPLVCFTKCVSYPPIAGTKCLTCMSSKWEGFFFLMVLEERMRKRLTTLGVVMQWLTYSSGPYFLKAQWSSLIVEVMTLIFHSHPHVSHNTNTLTLKITITRWQYFLTKGK